MDKALNYLAIARKARLIEAGEEPVGAAARALHARLIVVASDASDHTWRRAKSFAAGTSQQTIRVPFTKAELGFGDFDLTVLNERKFRLAFEVDGQLYAFGLADANGDFGGAHGAGRVKNV